MIRFWAALILLVSLWDSPDADKVERLLINDLSVIADRLNRLENVVAILNNTVKQLVTGNQLLTTVNQQQAVAITQLQTSLNSKPQGATYVRWARKQCPHNNTELVYSGYAGGGKFDETGSSAEPICLPPDPDFEKTSAPGHGHVYGAEFDNSFFIANGDGDGEDVPCSVCRVIHATSTIMIPGKNKCYSGWHLEYHGYLASNYYGHAAAGSYVCIDIQPEFLTGGKANDNGKLFYETIAKCGSLQCPPYMDNYPLTCVVCSK